MQDYLEDPYCAGHQCGRDDVGSAAAGDRGDKFCGCRDRSVRRILQSGLDEGGVVVVEHGNTEAGSRDNNEFAGNRRIIDSHRSACHIGATEAR